MVINIKGYEVLIDDEDYDKVNPYRWCLLDKTNARLGLFYFRGTVGSSRPLLHRFIMNLSKYTGTVCDHINGDTLDNRKCNLRICTAKENNRNCKKPKSNTSGFKGVVLVKRDRRWRAEIRLDRKRIHLGCFDTPELAYNAYCEASKKYHGYFGRTI